MTGAHMDEQLNYSVNLLLEPFPHGSECLPGCLTAMLESTLTTGPQQRQSLNLVALAVEGGDGKSVR